jgi:uncharacterized protein (DUF58 family)
MSLKIKVPTAIGRLNILTKNIVNSSILGNYKSVFRGHGLEFDGYREYTDTDDASLIDWKASAKCNQVLVKEYVEERNLNVFVLVDVSSSMMLGTTDKLKSEYAAELGAALGFTVLSSSDSFGFAMFSDDIITTMHPQAGNKSMYLFMKHIVDTERYGGKNDLSKALKFMIHYLRETAVVFIISDFTNLDEEWLKYLKLGAKKYDIIGIMIRDPLDNKLPDVEGNIIFEDPNSDEQVVVNAQKAQEEYFAYTTKQKEIVKTAFQKYAGGFISLETDKPFVKPLLDFFKRREAMFR